MSQSLAKALCRNEEKTKALARRLAPVLVQGDIIGLSGELGAGKSVFARSLIQALTATEDLEVQSPSFTIVQVYDSKSAGEIWHVDLYRLQDPEELVELGLESAFDEVISVIEWPERAKTFLPDDVLYLRLDIVDDDMREITASGSKRWSSCISQVFAGYDHDA